MGPQRYERVRSTDSAGLRGLPRMPAKRLPCDIQDRDADRVLGIQVANDDAEHQSPVSATPGSYPEDAIPASPPPSFRSRASSPSTRHLLAQHDPLREDAERTLDEAFDSPSDDEDDGEGRTRLINNGSRRSQDEVERSSGTATQHDAPQPGRIQRQPTELPAFTPQNTRRGKVYGAGNASDGVFANLSAKPQRGDNDPEEKPPVCLVLRNIFTTCIY